MPTRNVVLTDHQEKLIASLVASGQYQNASEVIREGLRVIEERAQKEAAYLHWLRAEAQVGIDAIERGDYKEFEDVEDLITYLDKATGEIVVDMNKP